MFWYLKIRTNKNPFHGRKQHRAKAKQRKNTTSSNRVKWVCSGGNKVYLTKAILANLLVFVQRPDWEDEAVEKYKIEKQTYFADDALHYWKVCKQVGG